METWLAYWQHNYLTLTTILGGELLVNSGLVIPVLCACMSELGRAVSYSLPHFSSTKEHVPMNFKINYSFVFCLKKGFFNC